MKNVDDIYSLSPMQEVMLLHSLSRAGDDVLFNQFCYEIQGDLDSLAFRAAWQQLVDTHPALRTCILWENLKQPLQIVREKLEVPFQRLDWSDREASEQSEELARLRETDRRESFNPAHAPLIRLILVKLAASRFFLIWSSHHLIMDRWSLGSLYQGLFAAYQAHRLGRQADLGPVYPFRDYIHWIRQQDIALAESFWRSTLAGFSTPSPMLQAIGVGEREPLADALVSQRRSIPASAAGLLSSAARANGLTPSILLQGALALMLNRASGRADLVFGSAVSGRPADLPGVESMVGSFINNVPVRARVSPDRPLFDWLRELQEAQQKRTRHDYVSLAQVQGWSDLPSGTPLFDSLFVWLSPAPMHPPDGLDFKPLAGRAATGFPFTLSVSEQDETLTLHADLQPGYRYRDGTGDLLKDMEHILERMARSTASTRLGDLGVSGAAEETAAAACVVHPRHLGSRFHQASGDTAVSSSGREALDPDLLVDMLESEWRALLGREAIGLDENFFEIGGNSILGAHLHAAIEINTRQAVPMMSLFREPSIRQMARLLSERDWPLKPDIVIPVNTRGSLPPLFCVASPDVNTFGYAALARHLPAEQPIYVLQAPPDSNQLRRLNPDELPGVAGTYVEAMREVQPEGPYYLLGMCTGSHLSLEMARQLAKSQAPVAFVGILNTWAFFTVSRLYLLARVLNRLNYYKMRFAQLFRLGLREQFELVASLAMRKLGAAPVQAPETGPGMGSEDVGLPAPSGEDADAALIQSERGDPWIEDVGWADPEKEKRIERFPGTVTVFRIRKQQFWRVRDETLGWGKLADGINLVSMPGKEHVKILREPGVRIVAQRLTDELYAARLAANEER